jgi:GT2 family glycosyltransferase
MSANSKGSSFSIITPAYNNPEEVRKLLDSVRPEILNDPTLEMIVVDDCSKDDSLMKVARESGFAEYMRLEKNSGPAEARNAGARAAKNDLLIFVDSDVVLNKDTFPRIREKFAGDGSIQVFGGEYDLEPANPSLSTRFKSLMVASWRPKGGTVSVFLTRLGVIKKSIFTDMGGFDTSLRTASVEDYEFARRLINKGYAIHYDPAVTVTHHFPSFKKQIKLFFHRSFMWVYIFRRYGGFDNTCTTPLQGASQLFGFLASAFFVLALVNIRLMYVALLLLALFILTSLRFFSLALKEKGILFTLVSVPMSLAISCSIVLGAAWGLLYYFLIGGSTKKNT